MYVHLDIFRFTMTLQNNKKNVQCGGLLKKISVYMNIIHCVYDVLEKPLLLTHCMKDLKHKTFYFWGLAVQ